MWMVGKHVNDISLKQSVGETSKCWIMFVLESFPCVSMHINDDQRM